MVHRCLEKNPKKRFESIQDVLIELQNCENEGVDEHPQPAVLDTLARPINKIDVEQAMAITAQINYANAVRSRNALAALERVLEAEPPAAVRNAISRALRAVILTVEPDTNGVARSIRDIRKETLDTLKLAVQGNLRELFSEVDLESIDLYAMNFSDTKLAGLSFSESFLGHADFGRADLRGCSLSRCWLRNANFQDADMEGADFTGADWFNATGLTERQMASVQTSTVKNCPSGLDALHDFLELRYRHSFKSWGAAVQRELTAAWKEYLRPGGLREFILAWHAKSR